jgi:hypothetical protein
MPSGYVMIAVIVVIGHQGKTMLARRAIQNQKGKRGLTKPGSISEEYMSS